MIKSAICILYFVSTISALSAPPDVYSAVIHNAQDSPIECNIIWSKPSDDTLQSGLFTIEQKQNYYTDEKTIDMGTWQAHAIIKEIHCGDLVLTAPFEGVESPKTNWEFTVYSDKIVSDGSKY
jgi:hypothetical protein